MGTQLVIGWPVWIGRHWQIGRCDLTTQMAWIGSHRTKSHGFEHFPPKQDVSSVQSVSRVQLRSEKTFGGGWEKNTQKNRTNYLH